VSWKAFTPQKALINRRIFENQSAAKQLQFGASKRSLSCLWAKEIAKNQQRQLTDLGSISPRAVVALGDWPQIPASTS
jgi:hypothetical protein